MIFAIHIAVIHHDFPQAKLSAILYFVFDISTNTSAFATPPFIQFGVQMCYNFRDEQEEKEETPPNSP